VFVAEGKESASVPYFAAGGLVIMAVVVDWNERRFMWSRCQSPLLGWLRGPAVEHWSLADVLSLRSTCS